MRNCERSGADLRLVIARCESMQTPGIVMPQNLASRCYCRRMRAIRGVEPRSLLIRCDRLNVALCVESAPIDTIEQTRAPLSRRGKTETTTQLGAHVGVLVPLRFTSI